ncbi:MAG: 50S ribosomal protein L22 [Phycisphaerae bacterium]|nr:50S ribosomal protein L22 [Phycisphaerae bacterium]
MRSDIKNWENGLLKSKGLFKKRSSRECVEALATALNVTSQDLECWHASHKFCPMAPRKIRLVADLVRDRDVQDALDVLKFANKRAAVFVSQVLKSAIGSAAENEVDTDQLYISEIRVDEGGIRRGTRRWRPKDRGRAVSFTRLASHIFVSVDVEK